MNKYVSVVIGIFMLIIQQPVIGFSQVNVARYELGASIGAFVYQGDLTPSISGSYRTMKPAINLYGSKILNASFLLRANLAFGKLKGNDALYDHPEYRQQRNFNFHSPVFEISGLIVWNPLSRNYDDKGISPYLFTGIGASFLKIKRDWSNFNATYFGETSDLPARIAIDAAHKLPGIIPVLPAGVGIRYGITSRIVVNAEASYRFVFTDYLDGFSVAANPSKGDHYNSISIGAIYRIGKKNMLDCPKVRY